MALTLPFAHLNLRCNPFGEPPPGERAGLAVIDEPDPAPGTVLQFIGHSGRGKSTRLLALAARHPGSRYVHVPEGDRDFDGPVTEPFFLDEAQRVRPRRLRRLFATARTLVLGTHEDLSGRTGRPVLTVRLEGLTRDRLREITGRRIEWARRNPGAVPSIPDRTLDTLLARHGDDVRAIEAALYDAFQAMTEPADVQV